MVLRCDRVDFPPGGIAYRHVHPGAGIRRILHGALTIDRGDGDRTHVLGRGVVARGRRRPGARDGFGDRGNARSSACCCVRPSGRANGRSRYVDPADEDKPRLQRATILLEVGALRNGGQILVDQLELNGADLAFCLPGESYLPVLDALYDSPIRLITCRHTSRAPRTQRRRTES